MTTRTAPQTLNWTTTRDHAGHFLHSRATGPDATQYAVDRTSSRAAVTLTYRRETPHRQSDPLPFQPATAAQDAAEADAREQAHRLAELAELGARHRGADATAVAEAGGTLVFAAPPAPRATSLLGEDAHAAFHRRSALPTPSGPCGQCPQATGA